MPFILEHAGQCASFLSFIECHSIELESKRSSRPLRGVPNFASIFSVSIAWMLPMIPSKGAMTPFSEQDSLAVVSSL